MKIINAQVRHEVEPLINQFGFKGGALTELWQPMVKLESANGLSSVGVGVQSVLWSDEEIFRRLGQEEGNKLMLRGGELAVKALKNGEFSTPFSAFDAIFPEVYEGLKKEAGRDDLRETFALNSLVAADNALWQLYGKEKGTEDFLELLDEETRKNLSHRTDKIYFFPLISYDKTSEEIEQLLKDGHFFFKIKIGSDPEKDGDREKMLEWDKKRLEQIHNIAKRYTTSYTDSGNILYYLDANGRYDSLERLNSFLDFADKIGALDRISILEEPFSEDMEIDVSKIPVRVAADESAHSRSSVIERAQMGYKAIALKPIAKTITETLGIINVAEKLGLACFCADLTVNPVMVEINKYIAARLPLFPGFKIGIFESNGPQNYVNWEKMQSYHPMFPDAKFLKTENFISVLDDEFYKTSGGIFITSNHYNNLF